MQQQNLTKIFAVFGDPIGHSLSPVMHNAAFRALGMDCTYHAFRVSRENLKSAILGAQAMGFGGLSLTIPLKEEALSIVSPEPMAASIGAVNTVSFDTEKGPVGNNTDGIGAKKALLDAGVDVAKKNVVIIGAGGAARAIAFQFAHDGANVHIANRTQARAVALADDV
ncbi:MAG: shikimate dehydrogenase, partial [Methanosarcinales archaeon]|nr:shikimate dehydrogenase [Methanosarcinales archaeon]